MKPLIQLANTTEFSVAAGNTIPLGGIVHRVGNCLSNTMSGVYIASPGYYLVDFNTSFTGTAGDLIVNIKQNGNTIAGATAKHTVVADRFYNNSIPTVAKVYCCAGTVLSVEVDSRSTSTPTFENVALRIVKD